MLYNFNCLLPVNSGKLIQYSAATTATLSFLIMGTGVSWSSPMLPELETKGTPFQVSREMGSWIVSAVGIGGILAPIPVGLLADRVGRKPVIILTALPVLVSWFLIAFTRSAVFLLVARLLLGLSSGVTCCLCPMYICEIAEEDIRGVLGTLMQLMLTLGTMFEFVISEFLTYQEVALSSAVFPAVLVVLILVMPETPTFLLMKGRVQEAEKSLMLLLRGSTKDVKRELEQTTAYVQQQKGNLRDLVATRGCRRAFLVMLGLITAQQFSGIMVILSYAEQIFNLTPGTALSSRQSAMFLGAIQVLATLGSTVLIDRIGRRPLLFVSTGGCALAVFGLGAIFYLHEAKTVDTTPFSWLPLTLLVIFFLSFCLGLGPITLTVIGEVFPPNVKGIAMAIGIVYMNVVYFLVTKFYQIMVDSLGTYTPFWFFGAICTLAVVFVYFVVPETKGKKLDVIVAELNGQSPRVVEAVC